MRGRRPLREAIVLVEMSPSGGLFQFTVQLGDALAADGHQVILLTGPNPELSATQPGLDIRPVLPTWHPGDRGTGSPTYQRVLRAGRLALAWVLLSMHLLRLRPRAVLWSNWRFSFEPLFVRILSTLLPGTTLGLLAHEPLPRSDAKDTSTPKSGPLIEAAFGAAWRCLDVVFVLGEDTRDVALRRWRPRAEVVVIPHGDEGALLKDVPEPVTMTGPVVLFFGTWTSYKGLDVLLEAFAKVRSVIPQARLVLAGDVSRDFDLLPFLAAVKAVGNVDAHPGYVPVDQVAGYLSAARVVVTPYVRASQSGVVHLAYTFGRPVVGTTVGALPESIRDGSTGLLVPPGDPDRLAEALTALLRDPELASRLGAAGKEVVSSGWQRAALDVAAGLQRAEGGR
jgi:glycosyltransferase involved in cell wall biosynthesis